MLASSSSIISATLKVALRADRLRPLPRRGSLPVGSFPSVSDADVIAALVPYEK